MFYSIGIDISKDDFKACILEYNPVEQTERVRSSRKFNNTQAELPKFVSWVTKWESKQPAPVRITMEATGVYYERVALHLFDNHPEWALSVVLPSQARRFNESEGFKNKTDRIDARGLALMGARKKLQLWRGIKPYWSELRQLTRTRGALVEQRTQLKNQLHALNYSAYAIKDTRKIVQQTIAALDKQITKLEKLITRHLDSDPEIEEKVDKLKSIPSIGLITISTVLAETLGFEYFTSRSQLISYAGYDIVVKESGKHKGKRKMSKQGNARIRAAMYMPVGNILSHKRQPYYNYYDRLVSRHGIKMKANVALQKKLLCLMYHLWKKNEAFDAALALRPAGLSASAVSPKGDTGVDTTIPELEMAFFED
ncbi:Transposase [Cyclonatronum proteinivorum]|uniref:Transposase n=1 Tax=Cyclonatronum proteinivorum TaxID=1457365 RepID=A0A345UFT9_9BACT|nr:IS110 family transposase [Cyclonatronum proteinivorum]AXI99340.1 Transposase [Cyclonatronum proteinivorum]